MKKATIHKKLKDAGVEIPANATEEQLSALAAANGIDLGGEGASGDVLEFDATAAADPDAELIAEKVRAGLNEAQAREVIARQRAEDKANAAK